MPSPNKQGIQTQKKRIKFSNHPSALNLLLVSKGAYRGWNPTQLDRDYFISHDHEIRIPEPYIQQIFPCLNFFHWDVFDRQNPRDVLSPIAKSRPVSVSSKLCLALRVLTMFSLNLLRTLFLKLSWDLIIEQEKEKTAMSKTRHVTQPVCGKWTKHSKTTNVEISSMKCQFSKVKETGVEISKYPEYFYQILFCFSSDHDG